ncbi:MAG: PD40 domain-containing protein [Bdellovibrionales bacterium]|nr:PD40 domain-containing protein [Bdellovibrionales bacterium]
MSNTKSLGVALFFLHLVFPIFVCAQDKSEKASGIYIDVGQASVKRSLLALPAFQFFSSDKANSKNVELGQLLFNVTYNDLLVSNYFTFIRPEAFLEDTSKVGLKPAPGDPIGFNFQNWRTIGTEFLVRAGYKVNGDKLSLEIYVYHVPQTKLILGKVYEGPTSAARKIAHSFCNDLIKALTGKRGIFLTRVVAAASESSSTIKEIYTMDWDGANLKKISQHKSVAISPAWSPDGKKVAYTAFAYHPKAKTRNADMFMYELDSAKRWLVSYRKGMNSGAAFMPSGDSILVTLSQSGSPDIFEMSLDGKSLRRITHGPNQAMNLEPTPSPDGSRIAFSSDRSGQPMIYVMNKDGSNVKRMTFAGRYNSSPSWSPDGKSIAFAGTDRIKTDPKHSFFDIFVVDVESKQLTRVTSATKPNGRAASNEDPSFSPDGRHIMFVSDRTGKNQLYIASPDGSNERRITVDSRSYYKPKWSSLEIDQ